MKPTLLALFLALVANAADAQNSNSPVLSSQVIPSIPQVSSGITNQAKGTHSRPTGEQDYTKFAALIVSVLALGYTVLKDRKMDKRMKKVEEEQEREKAEAAIRRSKASAPYFSPSKKLFRQVCETAEDGGVRFWDSMNANVLSIQRKEIPKDAPQKTPVIIVLDTGGKGARRINIAGDVQDVELKQEPDIDVAHGLVFLKYPYASADHGKSQKVVLSFETEDGLELTHTYETRHGCFEFYRVDPK